MCRLATVPTLLLACIALLTSVALVAAEPASLGEYPDATLVTTSGCELSLPTVRGKMATVLVTMSVECPISNEYLPAIKAAAATYRELGVNLVGIDPNAGETLAAMTEYARANKLDFLFARDADAKVTRGLRCSVTPEVCVFDRSGTIVYRGRIDDRYRAGGGQPGAQDHQRPGASARRAVGRQAHQRGKDQGGRLPNPIGRAEIAFAIVFCSRPLRGRSLTAGLRGHRPRLQENTSLSYAAGQGTRKRIIA